MPPTWLTTLSWAMLAAAFSCAVWILRDTYARGYRQPMKTMEAVWPVTALHFGLAAVAAYRAWGRPASERWQDEHGDPPPKPGYAVAAPGSPTAGPTAPWATSSPSSPSSGSAPPSPA